MSEVTVTQQNVDVSGAGEPVRLSAQGPQGEQVLILAAEEDPRLAPAAVRVPAGHADTAALGAMFGLINVSRV